MSYLRIIPRDLFNEANLLKCLGQVYLNLEKMNPPDVELVHTNPTFDFQVEQDSSDGSLSVLNVQLVVGGVMYLFKRPLNSRQPWPLELALQNEDMPVFNDDGTFSQEMIDFLTP